jgi:hypothetical protein
MKTTLSPADVAQTAKSARWLENVTPSGRWPSWPLRSKGNLCHDRRIEG